MPSWWNTLLRWDSTVLVPRNGRLAAPGRAVHAFGDVAFEQIARPPHERRIVVTDSSQKAGQVSKVADRNGRFPGNELEYAKSDLCKCEVRSGSNRFGRCDGLHRMRATHLDSRSLASIRAKVFNGVDLRHQCRADQPSLIKGVVVAACPFTDSPWLTSKVDHFSITSHGEWASELHHRGERAFPI